MTNLIKNVWMTVIFLTSATIVQAQEITIDENHFPDPAFREWVGKHFTPESIPRAKTMPFSATQHTNRYENRIESLQGLEYFTALEALSLFSFNSLPFLDLSRNPQLKSFFYVMESNNATKLSSLNLMGASGIETLSIENSDLASLDFSSCANLKSAKVVLTPALTTLDLSRCIALESVVVGWGKLNSLKLPSGSERLTTVNVMYNGLSDEAMDAFVEGLPIVANSPLLVVNSKANIYAGITEGDNRMSTIQAAIAADKGWLVRYRDEQGVLQGPETAEEEGLVDIDEQSFPDTHFRSWVSRNFKSFTLPMQYVLIYDPQNDSNTWPHATGDDLVMSFEGLEHFTALRSFIARNLDKEESVTELNVSKCKNLQTLSLSKLPCLKVLDASGAEDLKRLEVSDCPLAMLKLPEQSDALDYVYLKESTPIGTAADDFFENLPSMSNAPLLVIDGDNCYITEDQAAIAVSKGWRVQYTDEKGIRHDDETVGMMTSTIVKSLDGMLYDLQGRRVTGTPRPGTYIQEGRKRVVK